MAANDSKIAEKAVALLRSGKPTEALAFIERHASESPLPASATRIHAQCLVQIGDLNAALEQQQNLIPADITLADKQGRADALYAAQIAQMAMYYEDAAAIARQLVESDPQDIEAAKLLATLVLWLDGPAAAQKIFERLLGQGIKDVPAHFLAEALAYYDELPAKLIAHIRQEAENESLPAQTRSDLLLALAQHADRNGDFDLAWKLADNGNTLVPKRQKNDWHAVLEAHLQMFRTGKPVKETSSSRHCYLLGTARSGQSLFQSILAASPEVASIGERGALLQHVLFRTGEIIRMPPAQRSDFYQQLHESDNRGLAKLVGQPRMVVDKSPLHIAVAGSIALIHPGAAFGAILRDPSDMAMSIWIRSFPPIYDFASDLDAIFDHIDYTYQALEAWRTAGIDIRLFDHAELVADPKTQSKALFDWLNLEWSDEYLKAENRTEPVPTFSAAQVRSPISSTVARGAAPYLEKLASYGDRIENLRLKKAALLDSL